MASAFHTIMLPALYAGVWGFIILIFVSVILRGFFWKYLKVRTSFGKKIMVKVTSAIRDDFEVGCVEDGFLVFKRRKNVLRLNVPRDRAVFYRCLAVLWVDVDDEKNSVKTLDNNHVSGFDAVKHSDLHTRALLRPAPSDDIRKKLMIIGGIAAVIMLVALLFMTYKNTATLESIKAMLPDLARNIKGVVTTGGTVI